MPFNMQRFDNLLWKRFNETVEALREERNRDRSLALRNQLRLLLSVMDDLDFSYDE